MKLDDMVRQEMDRQASAASLQQIEQMKAQNRAAVTQTLIRAARSIYLAANSTGLLERREELLSQFHDQCEEIAKRTGRNAEDVEKDLKFGGAI